VNHAEVGDTADASTPVGAEGSELVVHTFRQDCGRPSKASLLAVPGAGMEPGSIEPFSQVLKDGFYEVDCVADYMFKHGDAHGDNRYSYKLGEVSNVSIVHYGAHVAKEDSREMTHEVCFSFCRTVPDMSFFGLTNGRECYCMPYYKAMADDSSMCDAPCDGNPGLMCGGKSKSSIFGMHACDNTAEQVSTKSGEMEELKGDLSAIESTADGIWQSMQAAAEFWQEKFGASGDPGASDLAQTAKAHAGDIEKAVNGSKALSASVEGLKGKADGMASADLSSAEEMKKAEKLLQSMGEAAAQGVAVVEELEGMVKQAQPEAVMNASKLYYPVMYFVDKASQELPSTCTGTAAEKPMVAGSMDACAAACTADVQECVGFSYMPGESGADGLCFLMAKLRTATYYTKCQGAPPVACMAKLSEFEGTTLKPDPSGKCDICLKELTTADRCFM